MKVASKKQPDKALGFGFLFNQARRLLESESSNDATARESFEWLLLLHLPLGVKVTVGKGGSNTTFIEFNGKSKVLYPTELLEYLEGLKSSKYAYYKRDDQLRLKPGSWLNEGRTIYGVLWNGSVVPAFRVGLDGKLR